jgi:hypothetical protein
VITGFYAYWTPPFESVGQSGHRGHWHFWPAFLSALHRLK